MKSNLIGVALVMLLAVGCNQEETKKMPAGYGQASYANVAPTQEAAAASIPTPVPPTATPVPTATPTPQPTNTPLAQATPTATVSAASQPDNSTTVPVEVQKATMERRVKEINELIPGYETSIAKLNKEIQTMINNGKTAYPCDKCGGKGFWIKKENNKSTKEPCAGCKGTGKLYPDQSAIELQVRKKKDDLGILTSTLEAIKKEKKDLEERRKSL